MNEGVQRIQSNIYVKEGEAPDIKLTHSLIDGQNNKDNPNIFKYDSLNDYYHLDEINKTSDNNLETLKEEELKLQEDKKEKERQEEDISGGNVIFANLNNISSKEKKLTHLYIIMFSYLLFCLVELICGYYSDSITLMADAAHYFAESSCFGIYIITIYVSRKSATNSMSFGFHRGEIIGILVRATFLLGFSFWLIYYTTLYFIHPQIVNGLMMIIIGIISTFFNLIMGLILMIVGISSGIFFSEKVKNCQHQHSDDELNCDSARKTFTSVIFKGIQSCIIIVAGVIVYFWPSIHYTDQSCTIILTGILLYEAFKQMDGVITILMEGSPLEFDVEGLEKDLLSVKGVIEVHDIHVWSLSIGKISMSCHLTTSEPQNSLIEARELIKKKYNITHTTIQVEINKENKKICKGNLH